MNSTWISTSMYQYSDKIKFYMYPHALYILCNSYILYAYTSLTVLGAYKTLHETSRKTG